MAEESQPTREEGAPWPKDEPDPELIKLRGPRPKVSVFSSAGLVFLAILFLIRLNPDRKFAGEPEKPEHVGLADVINNNIGADRFVALDAEPLVSRAMRTTTSKGSLGLRVVPARGTGDRLWLVVSGDGWDAPQLDGYRGRMRKLSDLPFAASVREFAHENPRPLFAGTAAVRAGFSTGKVATVAGDTVELADSDRVAFDTTDPDSAVIVAMFNDRFTSAEAWSKRLADAGIQTTPTAAPIAEEAWFKVAGPGALADTKAKLDKAGIFARVEPVTRHFQTTWGALRGSSTAGLTADKATVPDAQIDLVGLYVSREIPADAYALITGEKPEDYWYVTWIAVALAAIGLVFAWALVRAVRRDLLPART
jgi:hypothetical protein